MHILCIWTSYSSYAYRIIICILPLLELVVCILFMVTVALLLLYIYIYITSRNIYNSAPRAPRRDRSAGAADGAPMR